MKSLISLLCLTLTFTFISASSLKFRHEPVGPLTAIDEAWSIFKTTHKKVYANAAEEAKRKEIFAKTLKKIEKHNFLQSVGLKSFRMGVNKFSDLETSEFAAKMNKAKSGMKKRGAKYMSPMVPMTIPDSVDWREKDGYVTEVKDQGECGSCYSFAATGALEGQWFRAQSQAISLSEQNIIDCATEEYENHGCDGGVAAYSWEWVRDNGGIEAEDTYPYEASQGDCRYEEDYKIANATGYVDVEIGEDFLKEAVATIGPIAVSIDANWDSFQNYESGVYDEPQCTDNLNHAVLVVGYGVGEKDFWIVKNSYGADWGEHGYIRMSRNNKNQCGIANEACYPSV